MKQDWAGINNSETIYVLSSYCYDISFFNKLSEPGEYGHAPPYQRMKNILKHSPDM